MKNRIAESLKKRTPISNIIEKDPDTQNRYKPGKMLPSFKNSESIKFKHRKKKIVDIDDESQREEPLDQILQNILELLKSKEQNLKKFDPRHIQLIKKFENLNDFDKPPDVDAKNVETETESSMKRKRSRIVEF